MHIQLYMYRIGEAQTAFSSLLTIVLRITIKIPSEHLVIIVIIKKKAAP